MARRRTKIETYDDGLRELDMAIDWARKSGFENILLHLVKTRDVFLKHRDTAVPTGVRRLRAN